MTIAITCTPLVLPDRPRFRFMSLGIVEKAWSSVDKVPSAFDLLSQFQDNIALAMAPIRQYMDLIEAFALLHKCFQTIPDCITSLSPDPLLDCMKNLAKAIARVLAWMPPLSYVALTVDMTGYTIDLIDEIMLFFVRLDSRLDSLVTSYETALTLNDTALLGFTVCGINSILPKMLAMMNMVLGIKPYCNSLIDPLIRLLGLENLKKMKEKYEDADKKITKAKSDISKSVAVLTCTPGHNHPPPSDPKSYIPIPPMAPVLCSINQTRTAMVFIYNILAPIVGDDPDKKERTLPAFKYF
jgi:hypothetical protein